MAIYFISEIGINHNGDIETAKKLIKVAADCGSNAVKFQKRDIDLVYTKNFLDSPRESPWGTTQRDQKMHLEFDEDQYKEIDSYCKELSIDWFVSCWDKNSQEFMSRYNTKFNKIASPMIVSTNFLEQVASEKKHTFISTGMSNMAQIEVAVNIFRKYECSFELMHCVSTYPAQNKDINLNVINSLKSKFNCNVGYSGHESGVAVSCGAAAYNISSLERHITLDRSMYGSDQSASLEPPGLRFLIGAIRNIEEARGDGIKRFINEEKSIATKLRQHLTVVN